MNYKIHLKETKSQIFIYGVKHCYLKLSEDLLCNYFLIKWFVVRERTKE